MGRSLISEIEIKGERRHQQEAGSKGNENVKVTDKAEVSFLN